MSIKLETYSIGIYEGSEPFNLKPMEGIKNPVISRSISKNANIDFCADPFGVLHEGVWFLFFEIMPMDTRKGKIYVTTSSDLKTWSQPELVLEESFHLSYPQVFNHNGDFYMIPESYEADEVRLYRSSSFPFEWKFVKSILKKSCVDSTLFNDGQYWWMFTCDNPAEHNRLRLYYTEDLMGDWSEHPGSPIYSSDNERSRPGGRLFRYQGKLYRLAQVCSPFYGYSIKAFEISKLSTEAYSEIEIDNNPILQKGEDLWNKISMHHLDVHQFGINKFIAFVDGRAN